MESLVRAWALTRDGNRVESRTVTAGTKKEGQRTAAAVLVDRLRAGSTS